MLNLKCLTHVYRNLVPRYYHIIQVGSVTKVGYIYMSNMSTDNSALLNSVTECDIDTGKFKYILIKVHDPTSSEEKFKYIVRGNKSAAFHDDIYCSTAPLIEKMKLDCECVGGGRILHKPEEKTIDVYGYSQGFGKADHSITCDILKKNYADYVIKFSDEGY